MAIIVKCNSCEKQFRAKNSVQGKKTKCPKCNEPLVIAGEVIPDYDVFVSHSSKDEASANKVLHGLEESKIRCWIAPRDIKGGANWSSSIINAIENSRVMVLIYSSHSNLSQQVLREVERAVAKQVVIIPFRIDDTPMTQEMEYFLSTSHWLDALNGPSDKELARLTKSIVSLLQPGQSSASSASFSTTIMAAGQAVTSSKKSVWIASASAAVLLIGLVLVFFSGQLFSQPDDPGSVKTPLETNDKVYFDANFRRETQQLEDLIYENISPDEWDAVGGDQTLMFFDSTMFVSASEQTHQKMEGYLAKLRQAKGLSPKQSFQTVAPEISKTLHKMNQTAELEFIEVPLVEVFHYFEEILGVPIHLNELSLENNGIYPDEPVTFEASSNDNISYRVAFDHILGKLDTELVWSVMDGGAVVICFKEDLRWGLPIRGYDVSGILGQSHDKLEPQWLLAQRLTQFIENSIYPYSWSSSGGYGSINSIEESISVKNYSQVHRRVWDMFEQIRRAHKLNAPAGWVATSEKEQQLEMLFNMFIELEFYDTPLIAITEHLQDVYKINIRFDQPALDEIDIFEDQPVTVISSDVKLVDALELICGQIDKEAVFEYSDGFFLLTTRTAIETETESRFYKIADLLKEHPPGTLEQKENYEAEQQALFDKRDQEYEKRKSEQQPSE